MPAVGDEITPDGHPGGPDVVCTVDTGPVYATLDPDETFTTYSFMQTCTRDTPPQNNLCPAPNTALRNTAMQEVLFTGTVNVPPLMPLRQAFRALEATGSPTAVANQLFLMGLSPLRDAFLDLGTPTDKQWMIDNVGEL